MQGPASDVTKRDTGLSYSNPRPPTKPCRTCKQWGRWKIDCSQTLPTKPPGPPQAQQQRARNQTQAGLGIPDHGSSDEVGDDPTVPESFQRQSPSSRPQVHPTQMDSGLRVIDTVAGHKVSFLTDAGAACSLLTSFKSPLQPSKVAIKGVSDIPFYSQITPPLLCSFGKTTLTHSFATVPQSPMTWMGRNLPAKLQTSINFPFLDPISVLCIQMAPKPLDSPHSQNLLPDLLPIDPQVWDTEAPSVARHHSPGQVCLKNPSQVITQTQYILTTESRRRLKTIIPTQRFRALTQTPRPQTKRKPFSLLGLLNFFQIWVPNFALHANTLYQATQRNLDDPLLAPTSFHTAVDFYQTFTTGPFPLLT